MPIQPQIEVTYPNATYEGKGGYLYELHPDGRVRLLASPKGGAGKYVSQSNPGYSAIMGEIERIKSGAKGPDDPDGFSQYAEGAKQMSMEGKAQEAAKESRDEIEMNQARARARSSPDTGRSPGAAEARSEGQVSRGPRAYSSPGLLDDTVPTTGEPMPPWAKALLEHAPLPPQARAAIAANPDAWLTSVAAEGLGTLGSVALQGAKREGLGDFAEQWMTGQVPGQPMGAGRHGRFTEGAYSRAGNRFPEGLDQSARQARSVGRDGTPVLVGNPESPGASGRNF
jgi:hypothetical protein